MHTMEFNHNWFQNQRERKLFEFNLPFCILHFPPLLPGNDKNVHLYASSVKHEITFDCQFSIETY